MEESLINNHASSSSCVCVIILPLLFIRDHSFLSTLKHTHTHTGFIVYYCLYLTV